MSTDSPQKTKRKQRETPSALWPRFKHWAEAQGKADVVGDGYSVASRRLQKAWLKTLASANRLPPNQFKALFISKGWTNRTLGERWGIGPSYTSVVINNPYRDQSWDDAVYGLPAFNEAEHKAFLAKENS